MVWLVHRALCISAADLEDLEPVGFALGQVQRGGHRRRLLCISPPRRTRSSHRQPWPSESIEGSRADR